MSPTQRKVPESPGERRVHDPAHGVYAVEIPLRTVSEANVREHYMARARRHAGHRRIAGQAVMTSLLKAARQSITRVTLVRCGGRALDDDNLSGALKACRDGVADALGVTDGPNGQVRWVYAQEPGGGWTGVRVKLEAIASSP